MLRELQTIGTINTAQKLDGTSSCSLPSTSFQGLGLSTFLRFTAIFYVVYLGLFFLPVVTVGDLRIHVFLHTFALLSSPCPQGT